jgi:[ribosomal protein S18]-alanine N-acetyltransferase
MMRLRPLSELDLSLVRTWMRDDLHAPAWSEDDLSGLIRASDNPRKARRAWVAEDGPALMGFAVATALSIPEAPAECELEFVLVTHHARRRGIGIALMGTVLAWARDLGAKEIWLEVRKSNVCAVRLYERCGFAITGSRPGYYVDPVEDALLMRCQIEVDDGSPRIMTP